VKVETSTPDGVGKPIGPYSHVAKAGPFISISGTAGVDPATGQMAGPDAYTQSVQILRAFRRLLEGAGSDMSHVLHVRVYLRHVEDFEPMNRAYSEAFRDHLPARTVVAVSALPKEGALLTMDLSAVVNDEATGAQR
jgi:2-iminobutanoate/2-iminopropanoate deaminase